MEPLDPRLTLVVNGYSLGSITLLLDRLKIFILSFNGEKEALELIGGRGFLYDSRPITYNPSQNAFCYCLEDGVVEIIDHLIKFGACTTTGHRTWETKFEVNTRLSGSWQMGNIPLHNFFYLREYNFTGLTINDWQKVLCRVVEIIQEIIALFIPDFLFELPSITKGDLEHFVKNKHEYSAWNVPQE